VLRGQALIAGLFLDMHRELKETFEKSGLPGS